MTKFNRVHCITLVIFATAFGLAVPVHAYQVYGAIGDKWRALGADRSFLGSPISDESDLPNGGRIQRFQGGNVVWSPSTTGAHTLYGLIYDKWLQLGGAAAYGFPVTDESPGARGGRFNDFDKGNSIYWSTPTEAHAVYGSIRNKWRELGGDNSFLRYPTTDESPAANGGRMSRFEGGVIYWHPNPNIGAHTVYGRILEEWNRLGREAGGCGYPISDEYDDGAYRRSNFERGYILVSGNAVTIEGCGTGRSGNTNTGNRCCVTCTPNVNFPPGGGGFPPYGGGGPSCTPSYGCGPQCP